MPLPASLTAITVTGKYLKPDGSAAAGTVEFQLSASASTIGAIVPVVPVSATLDPSGAISVALAASDDPDWSQTGLTYRITERIAGISPRSYMVTIPVSAAGGTVDLAALAPVVPGPVSTSYVLASTRGVAGGVATLDGAGQVPLSQLGNAPAGGGGGGGATKPTVRRAYITSGDVTLAANAAWVVSTEFELDIPAAVGDYVELHPSFMHNSNGADFFDLAVLVGTTIVRRSSTGTASGTANDEGDPAMYPSPATFRTSGALFDFVVASGDLDGAVVRFVMLTRGAGGSKVFASTSYPFRWRALNHGPVN